MRGNADSSLVGVANGLLLSSIELKQQALMFDRLACVFLTQALRELTARAERRDFATELEFLAKQQFLYEPEFFSQADHLSKNRQFSTLLNEFVRVDKRMERSPIKNRSLKHSVQYLADYARQHELVLRLMSVQLQHLEHLDAVPLISGPISSSFGPGKYHVLEIVLNRMPQPSSDVPWEQILEFRNDPETKGKFWALRAWMSDVAKASLSPTEIVEKLECSLYEYQQHMNLARMKTNWGMCRTIVCAAAELAEDLVKFKWGKAAQLLFTLKDRKIALAEAELQSKGREVAYIVASREQFSRDG
jgi:hypothetical protein